MKTPAWAGTVLKRGKLTSDGTSPSPMLAQIVRAWGG
jgi:hypothetical protein